MTTSSASMRRAPMLNRSTGRWGFAGQPLRTRQPVFARLMLFPRPKLLVWLLLATAPGSQITAAPADSVPALPGSDWLGYNNSLDGQRYSLLEQINATNAGSLVEVCRARIAARGSLQSGLVVVGDSMFVTTATETFAIDPVTCRIKWQHSYRRSQQPGLSVNRGPAYLNGRVFRGTDDGRLVALDAATGAEAWTSVVGDASLGEYISAAPLAWNGLVIVGLSGGEFGIRGRI